MTIVTKYRQKSVLALTDTIPPFDKIFRPQLARVARAVTQVACYVSEKMTCRDPNLDDGSTLNPRCDRHSLPQRHCHVGDARDLGPESWWHSKTESQDPKWG